jgi:CRP/FNR family cyclic AMP-dependent transcriptional regulator
MQNACLAEQLDVRFNPREGQFFKGLKPEALKEFASLEFPSAYPAAATLFSEGETPSTVFVLLEGEVKLSINSSEGKRLILRIARAGEILGLPSALTGSAYEVTAETLHACKVSSVRRQDFQNFLMRHPAAYQNLIQEVTANYSKACEQLRTVGLTSSAPKKLARLLLDWCAAGQQTDRGTRVRVALTHEEIGEFIGASRETVTRTLSDFKTRHLVALHGSTMMIPSRVALEHYAGM